MMRKLNIILILTLIITINSGCEKEISVTLPPGKKSLVVEASINQLLPNLNYVYISRTIDYFNPDLSLNGVRNALVYITPGTIVGNDTIWNTESRIQMFDINNIPGVDSLLQGFNGIYFNPLLFPQVGVPYKLDIVVDGEKVTGVTTIPKVVEIDTVFWRAEFDANEGDTDMFLTFEFTDGPEQNNYRLVVHESQSPVMVGWGAANTYREFDDAILNNGKRPYAFFRPFDYLDTVNIYLNSMGRKEYLFWDSYDDAKDNGGPFATPVIVRSNITGAIGSFTGYGVSYRRVILTY